MAHRIAHAVLGCGAGAIAGGGCALGAVGGAVGEIVGGIYARDEAIQEFTDDLDALFRSEKGLTQAEADQLAANWKARGVDMAQLAGALAAFVVGKDVNTAASAAENAAKNNAIPLLIVLAPYAEAAAIYGLGVLTAFVVCRYSGNCVLPTDSTSTPPDDAVYSEGGEDTEQNNAENGQDSSSRDQSPKDNGPN